LSKNKSKSEILIKIHFDLPSTSEGKSKRILPTLSQRTGGGERDRTDDLLRAKQVLSQLSYTPQVIKLTIDY
jgi:hypothetical protein